MSSSDRRGGQRGGRGSRERVLREPLVAAVEWCFRGTLYHLHGRVGLPADDGAVDAVCVVIDYPSRAACFSRIVVNPTITGADSSRLPEYQACAQVARDHCFIGTALRTAIAYEVGEVTVRSRAPQGVEGAQ